MSIALNSYFIDHLSLGTYNTMVLMSMSHDDKKKYKESLKPKTDYSSYKDDQL